MCPARNAAILTYNHGKYLAEQLPVEIISSIASFLAGFNHNQCSRRYNLHNLVAATHVCQRWREAIRNDPRLWTDIQFAVTTFGWPYASYILGNLLPLSGNLALKISANFEEKDPALIQIFDASMRYDSLTLVLPLELCKMLMARARPFPRLRCLTLVPFVFSAFLTGGIRRTSRFQLSRR